MSETDVLASLKSAVASTAWKDAGRSRHWFRELAESLTWQVLVSEHFVFHYYHDAVRSHAFGGDLLDAVERLHAEVTGLLIPPPRSKQERMSIEGRCSLFVVHTDSARTFGGPEDPDTLFYLLDPQRDPEHLRRLRHEIAHLVWGRLYGEAPPLFNEGLAVCAEHMSAPDADLASLLAHDRFVLSDVPPLTEIADECGFWRRGPFYGIGGIFVYYLVERYGWDALRRLFLLSDYRDPCIVSHFAEVYTQGLASVDADWREYLRARGVR